MNVNELIKRLELIHDKTLEVKILDSYELTQNDNYEYVPIGKVYTEESYECVNTDGKIEWDVIKFIAIEQEN